VRRGPELSAAAQPGFVDDNPGSVVPNNAECWDAMIALTVADLASEPKPAHRRGFTPTSLTRK